MTIVGAILSTYLGLLFQMLPMGGIPITGGGPVQIASDTFVGTDGTSLGAHDSHWITNSGGVDPFLIFSNAARSQAGANALVHWNATFNANQYAQTTIVTISVGNFIGPAVRAAATGPSNLTTYRCVVDSGSMYLQKESGGETNITSNTSMTVSVNDVIRLEVTGTSTTSLTCKQNGTTILTGTDTTSPLTSGYGGISAEGATTATRVTPWSAGNL